MTKIHLQAAVRLQREVAELEKELKKKRKWVGLTDDEIWQEWSSPKDSAIDFARAIEAMLRERNGG